MQELSSKNKMSFNSCQAAILDLRTSRKSSVIDFDHIWPQIYDSLQLHGSLWILASNTYCNGEVSPIPLELSNRITTTTSFKLKNILVIYRQEKNTEKKIFASAYFNILFLVKSLRGYYFNKDSIRELHIFKDIEWGRRRFGSSGYSKRLNLRYSNKGRDPGNVLYRTERNSKGQILNTYGYTDKEIYEKIILLSTKEGSIIMSNIHNSIFASLVGNIGRRLIKIEIND